MPEHTPGVPAHATNEVVANVWDWDPEWRVVLYEGADRRGLLAPRVAVDPLASQQLAPSRLAGRRCWPRPFPTHHLLFAAVNEGHGPTPGIPEDPFAALASSLLTRIAREGRICRTGLLG